MRSLAERALSWVWVVLIAFLLADLTAAALEERMMLPVPAASPSRSPSPALPTAPAAAIPGELVSVLDTRPPEAIVEPGEADPADPTAPAAPVNPLNISLKGTIIGAGGLSLAVIDDGSGETKLLSVGEELADLKLVDIGPQSATFRQGTETRVLSLMESSGPAAGAGNPQPPVAANTPVAPAASSTPIKPPETMAQLQELLNNPAAASEGFKFTPINRKGGAYGVMLEFRKSSNLMAAIGLRHGDILLNVNGRPLKSTEDMYTAYQELRNSPTTTFEVDRGGQVVPIKFEVKE